MADPLILELPNVNGIFEVGIASSGDSSLPGAAHLHVSPDIEVSAAATNAAIYASTTAAAALGMRGDLVC